MVGGKWKRDGVGPQWMVQVSLPVGPLGCCMVWWPRCEGRVMHEVEVWVLVDSNGEYVAGADPDSLADLYDEQVGGGAERARRMVKVVLKMPVPEYATMVGVVPAEEDGTLSVM